MNKKLYFYIFYNNIYLICRKMALSEIIRVQMNEDYYCEIKKYRGQELEPVWPDLAKC